MKNVIKLDLATISVAINYLKMEVAKMILKAGTSQI